MADTPVSPSRETFFTNDVKYRRSLSEALMFKVGAAINFINDRIIDRYAFNMGGYFRATSLAQYTFESVYLKSETKVSYYTMSVSNSGTSGTSSINFKVINELGVELGNLFSTAPSIGEASQVNAMVGYDVKNSTEIRKTTTSSFSNGVIDPTYSTIPADYELKMFIVSGGVDALNLTVNLGLEAQS